MKNIGGHTAERAPYWMRLYFGGSSTNKGDAGDIGNDGGSEGKLDDDDDEILHKVFWNVHTRARLRDGTEFAGRVELLGNDEWYRLMDDHWDSLKSQTICLSLGYPDGKTIHRYIPIHTQHLNPRIVSGFYCSYVGLNDLSCSAKDMRKSSTKLNRQLTADVSVLCISDDLIKTNSGYFSMLSLSGYSLEMFCESTDDEQFMHYTCEASSESFASQLVGYFREHYCHLTQDPLKPIPCDDWTTKEMFYKSFFPVQQNETDLKKNVENGSDRQSQAEILSDQSIPVNKFETKEKINLNSKFAHSQLDCSKFIHMNITCKHRHAIDITTTNEAIILFEARREFYDSLDRFDEISTWLHMVTMHKLREGSLKQPRQGLVKSRIMQLSPYLLNKLASDVANITRDISATFQPAVKQLNFVKLNMLKKIYKPILIFFNETMKEVKYESSDQFYDSSENDSRATDLLIHKNDFVMNNSRLVEKLWLLKFKTNATKSLRVTYSSASLSKKFVNFVFLDFLNSNSCVAVIRRWHLNSLYFIGCYDLTMSVNLKSWKLIHSYLLNYGVFGINWSNFNLSYDWTEYRQSKPQSFVIDSFNESEYLLKCSTFLHKNSKFHERNHLDDVISRGTPHSGTTRKMHMNVQWVMEDPETETDHVIWSDGVLQNEDQVGGNDVTFSVSGYKLGVYDLKMAVKEFKRFDKLVDGYSNNNDDDDDDDDVNNYNEDESNTVEKNKNLNNKNNNCDSNADSNSDFYHIRLNSGDEFENNEYGAAGKPEEPIKIIFKAEITVLMSNPICHNTFHEMDAKEFIVSRCEFKYSGRYEPAISFSVIDEFIVGDKIDNTRGGRAESNYRIDVTGKQLGSQRLSSTRGQSTATTSATTKYNVGDDVYKYMPPNNNDSSDIKADTHHQPSNSYETHGVVYDNANEHSTKDHQSNTLLDILCHIEFDKPTDNVPKFKAVIPCKYTDIEESKNILQTDSTDKRVSVIMAMMIAISFVIPSIACLLLFIRTKIINNMLNTDIEIIEDVLKEDGPKDSITFERLSPDALTTNPTWSNFLINPQHHSTKSGQRRYFNAVKEDDSLATELQKFILLKSDVAFSSASMDSASLSDSSDPMRVLDGKISKLAHDSGPAYTRSQLLDNLKSLKLISVSKSLSSIFGYLTRAGMLENGQAALDSGTMQMHAAGSISELVAKKTSSIAINPHTVPNNRVWKQSVSFGRKSSSNERINVPANKRIDLLENKHSNLQLKDKWTDELMGR
ncbi:hypothetical protein HELRODRAFT_179683 [Helobdella robusta]|uniref:SRCR domain-containing protein n=1 Tax=Helobdella robusta TaxID=6412 RepID=T1FF09_HELRO|nr:hypothetical protein HELRODRAFT_179683 [Helobdella robusta]ESN95096.1 hypothetical protein HELRODRAFT_179683 [Helobdella robusta]